MKQTLELPETLKRRIESPAIRKPGPMIPLAKLGTRLTHCRPFDFRYSLLLALGLSSFLSATLFAEERMPSPQGTVEVAFAADQPLSSEPLHHVRYRVRFYYPHQQTVAVEDEFIDVYGEDAGAKPTPISALMKEIIWSPKEDFAVLPQEEWPSTHFQKVRQAVSLNTSFVWQTTDFPLGSENLAWPDRYDAIGNSIAHCLKSVVQFDANTGKVNTVAAAASPSGYEIVSVSNYKVLMKKVLDDCATTADQKRFVPECTSLDLRFMRSEITSCP